MLSHARNFQAAEKTWLLILGLGAPVPVAYINRGWAGAGSSSLPPEWPSGAHDSGNYGPLGSFGHDSQAACRYASGSKCLFVYSDIKWYLHPLNAFSGLFYAQNAFAAGTPPGPRWGSLQRSPDPLAGGRKLAAPPQELFPRSRPSV